MHLMLTLAIILCSTPKMVVHHASGEEKEQAKQKDDKEELIKTNPGQPRAVGRLRIPFFRHRNKSFLPSFDALRNGYAEDWQKIPAVALATSEGADAHAGAEVDRRRTLYRRAGGERCNE
jgi:hypothetical protein